MSFKHPEIFRIPPKESLEKLKRGDLVYLIFKNEHDQGERMWVRITDIGDGLFQGTLENVPTLLASILNKGDLIKFGFRHIADFTTAEEDLARREEYQDAGKMPGGIVAFSEVEKVLLSLSEALVDEGEKAGVRDELDFAKQEIEKHKDNPEYILMIQLTVFKFFLHVAISVIAGPLVGGSPRIRIYPGMAFDLEEAERIVYQIGETHLPAMVEYMEESVYPKIERISEEDLPEFLGSIVREAREKAVS